MKQVFKSNLEVEKENVALQQWQFVNKNGSCEL